MDAIKTVVVTGASGALGQETVRVLDQAGCELFAVSKSLGLSFDQGHVHRLGGVDLSYFEQAEHAIQTAYEKLGRIDALVNIAGGFCWESLSEGSLDLWEQMLATNLRTSLNACKAALPYLNSGSAIVNVGAAASKRGTLGMGAYTASKAAVSRLTESLADELRLDGIRVNMVSPTVIDTPKNRQDMPAEEFAHWVTPREVGHVIEFLISNRASGVNGAEIQVRGRL